MKSTEHWLVHQHTQLEIILKDCRAAAEIADWWDVAKNFSLIVEQLRFHMAQEEEILFPAYDSKIESADTVTQVLVSEHEKLIECFRKLNVLIEDKKKSEVITLLQNLQKYLNLHHNKEEVTFLPYASRLLFDDRDELNRQLKDFAITDKSRKWFD